MSLAMKKASNQFADAITKRHIVNYVSDPEVYEFVINIIDPLQKFPDILRFAQKYRADYEIVEFIHKHVGDVIQFDGQTITLDFNYHLEDRDMWFEKTTFNLIRVATVIDHVTDVITYRICETFEILEMIGCCTSDLM